ncbi:MAG: XRE family transcriptional regulator [Pseudomonadota bacterium]
MKKTLPPHVAEEAEKLSALFKAWQKQSPKERTQAIVAEQMGWQSQGTVSQYLTGRLELNYEALMKFVEILNCTPADISPRLAKRLYTPQEVFAPVQINEQATGRYRPLPVIGSVQAGSFCEATDPFQPGDADEWLEAYGPAGDNAFILKVEGFSMEPDFMPGDKVVVDPSAAWAPGDFIVAKRSSDNGVTLKQIRVEGNEYFLYATNPAWPDRIIRLTEEWHVCGKVRRKIVEY